MTLAVTEELSPNKPNLNMTLADAEALSPNKPNLNMTLADAEALSPNKPNLDMTLAVAEELSRNKPNHTFSDMFKVILAYDENYDYDNKIDVYCPCLILINLYLIFYYEWSVCRVSWSTRRSVSTRRDSTSRWAVTQVWSVPWEISRRTPSDSAHTRSVHQQHVVCLSVFVSVCLDSALTRATFIII